MVPKGVPTILDSPQLRALITASAWAATANGATILGVSSATCRSLHSVGWGVLRGTRDQNRIWINLDPDMFDNNTFLRGVVTGNIISGVWEYAGFPGVMDHGTFVAEKEP